MEATDPKLGKCLTNVLGLLHATTLRATSSFSRYWVMLVIAVVTTQRQGNRGRNTALPDRTGRLGATAFVPATCSLSLATSMQ